MDSKLSLWRGVKTFVYSELTLDISDYNLKCALEFLTFKNKMMSNVNIRLCKQNIKNVHQTVF